MEQKLVKIFSVSLDGDRYGLGFLHKIVLGLCPIELSRASNPLGGDIQTQINQTDDFGFTPLHWAAYKDDLCSVEKLLELGANMNIPDLVGKTPLFHSLASAEAKTAAALIAANASVEIVNRYGMQVLHLACTYGHLTAARLLLAAGANVNSRNIEGWTALILATRPSHASLVWELLKYGADIESKFGDWDETALFLSIICNAHDCLRLLISEGANCLHVNSYGSTILHRAALYADVETITILADLRLDKLNENALDSKGLTAAQVFARRGDGSVELRSIFNTLLKSTTACRTEYGSDEDEEFYDAIE